MSKETTIPKLVLPYFKVQKSSGVFSEKKQWLERYSGTGSRATLMESVIGKSRQVTERKDAGLRNSRTRPTSAGVSARRHAAGVAWEQAGTDAREQLQAPVATGLGNECVSQEQLGGVRAEGGRKTEEACGQGMAQEKAPTARDKKEVRVAPRVVSHARRCNEKAGVSAEGARNIRMRSMRWRRTDVEIAARVSVRYSSRGVSEGKEKFCDLLPVSAMGIEMQEMDRKRNVQRREERSGSARCTMHATPTRVR
ncbi:hypothetical protein B0H19DRAFT_1230192 [Mycena capillaripes]|nr:hypothetical protein B0H19DRAFT_1230192 [Mycena capillaripes]